MKWIYGLFFAFFIFIIIYSLSLGESFYVPDSILFLVFSTLTYIYYKKLNLNPIVYFIFNIGMGLHLLGRFGFYRMQFFGVNWDIYTHVIGSIGTALLIYSGLSTRVNLKEKGFFKYFLVIVFLVSVGIALMGEFMEFGGTLFLKNGQGLLGIEGEAGPFKNVSTNYWDTVTDLVANSAGSIIGIGFCSLFFRKT